MNKELDQLVAEIVDVLVAFQNRDQTRQGKPCTYSDPTKGKTCNLDHLSEFAKGRHFSPVEDKT